MKKQAKELKQGDKVNIAGQECLVKEIEISDIGKHGKRKIRLVVSTPSEEKIVIIRPEDYSFDST